MLSKDTLVYVKSYVSGWITLNLRRTHWLCALICHTFELLSGESTMFDLTKSKANYYNYKTLHTISPPFVIQNHLFFSHKAVSDFTEQTDFGCAVYLKQTI